MSAARWVIIGYFCFLFLFVWCAWRISNDRDD